ncbi:MAG: hypothetical protein COV44_03085 [Deltaproteobacteria bacterium CG11_big_fil_rev_8_21_14_0_20_45_16]|nr:MAG: hypothetical protein COV44_03085 [Deltaproteobacteria bacterium CG11_big_fil_rev_8_21_14_0_20_45_16]
MKCLWVSFFAVSLFFSDISYGQEVAISIDDAPHDHSPTMLRPDRLSKIIHGLQKSGVEEAIFFVVGERIDNAGRKDLIRYAKAGHLISNHTFSHRHPDKMGAKAYIQDIQKNDEIIRHLPNFVPLFRYPFLDQGKSSETRHQIKKALDKLNYKIGYVSIDTADWDLNEQYESAITTGKKGNLDQLRDVYISILWEASQFYEKRAQGLVGRPVKHVLLLHENALLALFLNDLINHYKKNGWKIIRASDAFNDPIYSRMPEVDKDSSDSILNQLAREKVFPEPYSSLAEKHDEVTKRFQATLLR